ncbi:MAG: sel1 repeat family protein [Candidatus Saccharibacteria bacterium]|nr:sel1 repeat family protein [Moraxellaceae bacterium]
MQNISEVLQLEHNHSVIRSLKRWLRSHYRAILKTVLWSLVGLVVLVGFSSAVWLATWHGDIQLKIGRFYENGSQLTPQNYTKAFAWYSQSAAKGDVSAQLKLAEMYSKGKGTHQDLNAAVAQYRTLADQGNSVAQYQLGMLSLSGQGVIQNFESGLQWLEKSANKGNAEAAYKLGTLYGKGFGADADEQNILSDTGAVYSSVKEGVSQNYSQSAHWYLKAATLGHAEAQSALGMLYFEGKGVKSNDFAAYILEAIATVRGSVKAPIFRSQVVAKLTQNQIMAAQPLIDNWAVGHPIIFTK